MTTAVDNATDATGASFNDLLGVCAAEENRSQRTKCTVRVVLGWKAEESIDPLELQTLLQCLKDL